MDGRGRAPARRRRRAFRAAYWQHRHAYDADLPAAAYWQRVAAATRPGPLGPGDLAWLIVSDVASWTVYHDEIWALAARFRAESGRTAFLSNSGPEVMARVRADHPLEARLRRGRDLLRGRARQAGSAHLPAVPGAARPVRRPPRSSWTTARTTSRAPRAVGLQTLQFEGPDALARLRALVR